MTTSAGIASFKKVGAPIHGHPGIARTADEFAAEGAAFHTAFHFATRLVNPDQPLPTYFALGGCDVEVVATPGHTPTNISLFVRDEGVLYCGDCLTHLYAPNLDAGNGASNGRTWLVSLDRSEALRPQVIVCGHGPIVQVGQIEGVIENVREALRQRLAETLAITTAEPDDMVS